MSGREAEARAKGGNAAVGTRGVVVGGDTDGGLGGESDIGGRGYGQDVYCDRRIVKWIGVPDRSGRG